MEAVHTSAKGTLFQVQQVQTMETVVSSCSGTGFSWSGYWMAAIANIGINYICLRPTSFIDHFYFKPYALQIMRMEDFYL